MASPNPDASQPEVPQAESPQAAIPQAVIPQVVAAEPAPAKPEPPATSATTLDVPSFGWSGYAERINGRFAMVGFTAVLVIEAFSGETFLHWAGLVP
jgi:cell division protein FtsN